jgi:ADP-heptose:LPS heptosyltransferase
MKFGSSQYGMGDTLLLTSLCKYFPNKFTIQLTEDASRFSIFFDHLARIEVCAKNEIVPIADIGASGHYATRKLRNFFGNAADGLDNRPLVLFSDKESEIWASDFLKHKKNPCIVVKNCSKRHSDTRSIPDSFFSEILKYIKKNNTPIICQSSFNYTKTEEIEFTDLDLKKYIALLRQTGIYYGANTGDEHLATALGCRTFVWQPKDSEKFNSSEWNYNHPNSTYLNW